MVQVRLLATNVTPFTVKHSTLRVVNGCQSPLTPIAGIAVFRLRSVVIYYTPSKNFNILCIVHIDGAKKYGPSFKI